MIKPAHTVRLVLGDQLDPQHSWFGERNANVVYLFIEMRQETDYVLHHAQKIIAIFAAMRDFARRLTTDGHRVHYLAIDDVQNTQAIPSNLDWLLADYQATVFAYQEPDEWRLDQQLRDYATTNPGIECKMHSSEHFYTERDTAQKIFAGRKQWLMENFYRQMRKQNGILMDGPTEPVGSKWNYDHDNRKPWRGTPAIPKDDRVVKDHGVLWQTIQSAGVKSFGDPNAAQSLWPLHRAEALEHLDHFIAHTLPHFGDFQDAMSHQSVRMFHALISFALNVKMLRPHDAIERAERAYYEKRAPLEAVEGFIRQILGWREYVRGVYWAQMPGYTEQNALNNTRRLPRWFWDADTKMRCLSTSIKQSLDHAYAHHIQRLMVIGNFALLAGVNPEEVHQWYLGVYIDAFEWVEAPNTVGMSQFADGGFVGSKPYVSSAAYINRMSDYCNGCAYKPKERLGPKACPFNALYWDFHARHKEKLEKNPRLFMPYRHLMRMDPGEILDLRAQAKETLEKIDSL